MRHTAALLSHSALLHNLHHIRSRAPGKGVIAMVKANAYGHGAVEVARRLEHAGVEMLGVAFEDEGIALRRAGITAPILVLVPPRKDALPELALHSLDCCVDSAELLEAIAEVNATGAARHRVQAHLYVDTGMSRDGCSPREAHDILRRAAQNPQLPLSGLCTHFVSSDSANHTVMEAQKQLFEELIALGKELRLSLEYIHNSNSGAIAYGASPSTTHVRPGLSLYGYSPVAGSDFLAVRPILELVSEVISLRTVPVNGSVSYDRTYVAGAETVIATVSIGYGDGLSRSLSNIGHVIINNRLFPIVGRVCMDEILIRVDASVRLHDRVVVIGTSEEGCSISAADIARKTGTIAYEVLSSITERVARRWVD